MPTRTRCILLVLVATVAVADDASLSLPEQRQQLFVTERFLSGIDLFSDSIEQVIEKLGKPSRITVSRATDGVSETETYEWDRRTCWLRVVALGKSKAIERIDVWGTSSEGKIGTTGKGLQLGATLSQTRRIYALRGSFTGEKRLLYQMRFVPDGCDPPGIRFDFDQAGKVNHMQFLPTLCW